MEIIQFEQQYSQILKSMMSAFYNSDAVMHAIDENNFEKTIQILCDKSPLQECFLFMSGVEAVGYALVAITYSNEAGGRVAWLDELYVASSHRGHGCGKMFLNFMNNHYADFARFRLEIEHSNYRAEALYNSIGYENLPYKQLYQEILTKKQD